MIVLAFAPVPILSAPVVPESTVNADAAADERVTAPAPVYDCPAATKTPDVAVMSPEIVGVAVHVVPVTVRFPPSEVKLAPETVNVLSSVVAPWRVRAPGVVIEPIVLADEAAVPRFVFPVELRVVNAPVKGVVAPIAVLLIPVAVVLKCPEVIVKSFAPVLIEEADNPESVHAPDVAVMFNAPVVRANPLEAVRRPEDVTLENVANPE